MVCVFCQGSTGLQMLSKRSSQEFNNRKIAFSCFILCFIYWYSHVFFSFIWTLLTSHASIFCGLEIFVLSFVCQQRDFKKWSLNPSGGVFHKDHYCSVDMEVNTLPVLWIINVTAVSWGPWDVLGSMYKRVLSFSSLGSKSVCPCWT